VIGVTNAGRFKMLLDGEDMSEKNYVIPTAVLRRLLDAAAGRYVSFLLRRFALLLSICNVNRKYR